MYQFNCESEEIDAFERNIEQLEEATCLLNKGTITSIRIAFLLIHNILDLLTYEFTKSTFTYRDDFDIKGEKVFEYLTNFDDRITYLNKIKVLTENDSDILKVFHYIRNESYHTGVIKNKVLPSVTIISYNKVCELLKTLSLNLNTFCGENNDDYIYKSVDNYSSNFTVDKKDLAVKLSEDLLSRIKLIKSNLYSISNVNIATANEEEIEKINDMLDWAYKYYWKGSIIGLTQVPSFRKAIKKKESQQNANNFEASPYNYRQINIWETTATNLVKHSECSKILKGWKDIDVHLAHLELIVEAASYDINECIDWEVEKMRGK